MQSFGRREDLQVAKLAEVASKFKRLGDILARMMNPSPKDRISAASLAEFLSVREALVRQPTRKRWSIIRVLGISE